MCKLAVALLLLGSGLVAPALSEIEMDTIQFSIGMKYFNEKEYEKAVEEFRKMLTLYPDHAPSYYRIGACWRALDKNALSIYNLKKAAKYDPKNPDIFRELAEACFANNEAEAALAAMRQCIELEGDPAKKAADEERARVMRGGGGAAEAAPVAAETAVPAVGGAPAVEVEDEVKDEVEAEVETEVKIEAKTRVKAKAKEPARAAPAEREAAQAAAPVAEAPVAKDAFTLVTGDRHGESSSDTLLRPVLDAYNAGQYGRALKAARDLLKKKPGHAGAYYYGGVIRYYNQELDKAVVNFKQAFAYPEKGHNAHYYLGLIHERNGKTADAVREYEQYVNLTTYEAGKEEAKGRLSRLLKIMGKEAGTGKARETPAGEKNALPRFSVSGDSGLVAGDTACRPGDPRYAFVNARLGDAAFSKNDMKEALKCYLKALGQETDTGKKVNLYFRTGECYWRQGSDRGIEYFLQAVSADTALHSESVRESCFRLGDYYFRLKNLESALRYYRIAVDRFPKSAVSTWACYQIGNIYKMGMQYEEAIKAYQDLIESYPGDYWASRAKWQKEDAVWEGEYQDILK